MKIAFIVKYFPKLSETFISSQMIGLLKEGHEITIFAEENSNETKAHDDVLEFKLLEKVVYTPKLPKRIIKRQLVFLRLFFKYFYKNPLVIIRSLNFFRYKSKALNLELFCQAIPFLDYRNFDVVHCHFGAMGLKGGYLKSLGLLKESKLLTAFHGKDVNANYIINTRRYYDILFRYGFHYTANTNYTAKKAMDLGCPPDKISILPEGLEPDRFPFSDRSTLEQVRILTVGRLVEKKGIEYALRSLPAVLEKYPGLQYDILGDGPLFNSLCDLCKELHIEDNVQLHGAKSRNDVIDFFKQANVFVLPCVKAKDGDSEGQGLVLQEAQAMGVPVISTFSNGIPDGVKNNETGILIEERNPEMLAEKLQLLLGNKELRNTMGTAGRKFVEANYDQKVLTKRLMGIYQNMIR